MARRERLLLIAGRCCFAPNAERLDDDGRDAQLPAGLLYERSEVGPEVDQRVRLAEPFEYRAIWERVRHAIVRDDSKSQLEKNGLVFAAGLHVEGALHDEAVVRRRHFDVRIQIEVDLLRDGRRLGEQL